jgi:type IV secretion system protein TrbB
MEWSAFMADAEYAAAMARFLGGRVCELFADESIVEVYANGDLAVRTDGIGGRRQTDLVLSEESIRGFLNIAATREGISLGGEEGAWEIAAELPAEIFGKARLQGMVPPLVGAASFVVRKHPARILLFPELVASGSASAEQYGVLTEALAGGDSIIVSGATKSGKTNLVNALLHELVESRPDVRVVVLEDTPEVVCPARDTLRMVTVEKRLDLHDLVRIGVRCHPDVFVVGEVRGRDAYPFLDSMATGHGGGMCTIHAGSPLGALARLNRLAKLGASGELEQHELIAEVIRLVVQMAWVGSAPRIAEIVRIEGWLPGRGYELRRLA